MKDCGYTEQDARCDCPLAHPRLQRALIAARAWALLPGRAQAWIAGEPCWARVA